jgi:hypothetical protein
MPAVLILGGRAPAALDHARRFAFQGWQVHIADSIPCRLSGWSRAVGNTLAIAPPRTDPAGFIASIQRAIAQHKIDLVVPTCEEVFFLARYRKLLPATVRVAVDDFDILRVLHSKWQFQSLARVHGGNPPASALVTTLAEAREWADGAAVVLKPEFSRFGVHVRIYPQGIPSAATELPALGSWVVQHYIGSRDGDDKDAGGEHCSYSIAERGRLLAHAVYRPLYRLRTSASFYFVPYESAAIRAFVERLVAATGFSGQISFDWILSGDAIPHVIECNPRAISGVHLFAACDALPAALMGSATTCATPSSGRARMIASVMLTAGWVQAMRRHAMRRWWRDWRMADDVISSRGDFLPLAGGLCDIASYARLAMQQHCSLRAAATRDIEWDGEELAALSRLPT